MRKLIESTFVSLDGIIDDTRPSTASRAEPQHWGQPYWDDDHNGYAGKLLTSSDAMLLGRVTYEGFAEAWSVRSGPDADIMNNIPKYVASRTLTETTWNSTLIQGDVAEEVARLKEQPGSDLEIGGAGLAASAIELGLVDEFQLFVSPVVLGGGTPFFPPLAERVPLELVETRTFGARVVYLRYRRA